MHLHTDFRCGIHAALRQRGFPGCAVYDCFGAGQQVAQVTFGGQDWRRTPTIAARMFEVFGIMRQLHELAWYLSEALNRSADCRASEPSCAGALDDIERLTNASADALLAVDVAARRATVSDLLRRTSELARAQAPRRNVDRSRANLIGKGLRGADLRGASLRGAHLIGADLRNADLRSADVLGADFRGADLSGADLTDSLFLTQSQLEAAIGDQATRLPASLTRPAHWRRASA